MLNIILASEGMAQSTVVLPGNGKYSSSSAPQGALRYQRQFYLIDSAEMARSGVKTGLVINSIGFRYAVPQNIKTKGQLKVYLQNTGDLKSKSDTAWTVIANAKNNYHLSGLSQGGYEWQVAANCTSPSTISSISGFNITNEVCKSPTHLTTQEIGSTTATFAWIKPANAVDSFIVEWSEIDKSIWHKDTAIGTSYKATGLAADKTYKWKVTATCDRVKDVETDVFTTLPVSGSCLSPTVPVVKSRTDTTAVLSWTKATGAVQYDVWYRRAGTADWNRTFGSGDSVMLYGLDRGTTYEWKVRTVCGTGAEYGSFVPAASFTTAGMSPCFAPEKIYADSATSTAVKLSWDTIPGATSYTLRYRKRESISWSTAIQPMKLVTDSLLSLSDTTGLYTIPFKPDTTFTYTGKGVYVAFEYFNAADTLSTMNVALANYQRRYIKDINGEDSSSLLLSFEMSAADALPGTLTSSFLRPETWFGAATFKDSAEVVAVYAMGNNALPYSNPTNISALVRNYTTADKSYAVTLKIKNASDSEVHSEVKTVTVIKDSLLLVKFGSWTPAAEGKYSIIVSLPDQAGENVVKNNRAAYEQIVNGSMLSYADSSDATSFIGMDTAKGLILTRYKMSGCGAVNAVQVYLGPSAVGHSLYAVILKADGTRLDSSAVFIPDDYTVNRYHTFYFTSPVSITNGADFYVGLAQPDAGGYSPVGVQWEAGYTRDSAYYRAKLDGSGINDTLPAGRLMIRAEFVAGTIAPEITGNLVLCPGGASNTLAATSITRRFANSVVAFSSEGSSTQFTAADALGTPNVYPQAGFQPAAWMGATSEREYLVLKFPAPDSVNYIDIYETNNPGAIDTVYVKNSKTAKFDAVYTGAATASDATSGIKRITFPLTSFKVDEIRIALNGAASGGHNAIDAVSIGRLITPPQFASYAWSKKTSTGTTDMGTGTSIEVTAPGDYKLTVANGGCSSSATTTVTMQNQTLPVITASGPLAFCIGDSVILQSNRKGGNTWSTGATTDEIIVKASGTYSVTHNDGTSCTALKSRDTAVLVNTYPVVTITGKLGICPDSTTILSAVATGSSTYTYLWSNGNATNTNVVAVSGAQSVTVTDTVGCATTMSAVTVMSPKPQPQISGLLNFCPDGSTTLGSTKGFTMYAWSNGSSDTIISVNAVGKYKLTVTNDVGCKGSDSVVVGQFIPPSPKITGSLAICGGNTTLNAGGGFVNYIWSNSQTTPAIKVTEPGVSSVTVTDYNGCTGSSSVTTVKAALPPRPGLISSAITTVCNAPNNTFSIAPVPEATHYVWFVPKGATIISGQGTTSLKLAFEPGFISGDLMVAASNACGQSGSMVPRLFPINAPPATPGEISGATTGVCSGQKTYSVPPVDGATSYAWKLPAGTSIKSGQNTNAITVTFSPTFVSGSICVRAVNACSSSTEKCITVIGVSDKPGAITGPGSVCPKQTNVRYSITPVVGAKTYTWTVPDKASIVSGQSTASILVKFATTSGNITVKANNDCGSSAAVSTSVVITNCAITSTSQSAEDLAEIATRQQLERDVLSSAGNVSKTSTMQIDWTMGEPCIETMSSAKGMYTQGFHQPTAAITKETVVRGAKLKISAAPNPVSTKLRVSFEAEKEEPVMLSVRDVGGRLLFRKSVLTSDKNIEINMAGFSQGLYILNVQTITGVLIENFKIVKVN